MELLGLILVMLSCEVQSECQLDTVASTNHEGYHSTMQNSRLYAPEMAPPRNISVVSELSELSERTNHVSQFPSNAVASQRKSLNAMSPGHSYPNA